MVLSCFVQKWCILPWGGVRFTIQNRCPKILEKTRRGPWQASGSSELSWGKKCRCSILLVWRRGRLHRRRRNTDDGAAELSNITLVNFCATPLRTGAKWDSAFHIHHTFFVLGFKTSKVRPPVISCCIRPFNCRYVRNPTVSQKPTETWRLGVPFFGFASWNPPWNPPWNHGSHGNLGARWAVPCRWLGDERSHETRRPGWRAGGSEECSVGLFVVSTPAPNVGFFW